jgi:hypothetical protein
MKAIVLKTKRSKNYLKKLDIYHMLLLQGGVDYSIVYFFVKKLNVRKKILLSIKNVGIFVKQAFKAWKDPDLGAERIEIKRFYDSPIEL